MFFHGLTAVLAGRCRDNVALLSWVVLFAVVSALVFPRPGAAFAVNEWEKLDVEGSAAPPSVTVEAGKPWKEPLSGITFLWIPGGCFTMGSAPDAEGRDADEEPLHPVCLSGFWLGEREVTQQQWQRVMQYNPSRMHHEIVGQKDEGFPVENVSRLDVETFITKLNAHHQGTVLLRLPTEAQWEYACRNGGQKIPYAGYGQVDQMGWYQPNSSGTSHATGTRMANRLGLFDMNGNLWEWIQDNYDKEAYRQHDKNDPVFSKDTPFSVIRGGSWSENSNALRCANRGFERMTGKRPDLGVRLAATVDLQGPNTGGGAARTKGRGEMPF
ncbi:MAG: formylglycine-generating enzyme family protein [Magnetococcales bacterium]|nr:formylglycine-generating enzyme family protein [Magnetococcales bacterium]